jgi:dihydrofolate reductase
MTETRNVILFSAMSLDGFIAKPNGDIGWLFDIPNLEQTDHGYHAFYETIDTTLIGRKTYHQIIQSGGNFPYPDKRNFVFTHTKQKPTEYVEFITDDIVLFVNRLKHEPGKAIWVVGGGQINTILFQGGLIDVLQLQIFPILLNNGIPLSACDLAEIRLELIKTKVFPTGVVEVLYQKQHDVPGM